VIALIVFILMVFQNVQSTELKSNEHNVAKNNIDSEVVANVGNIKITNEEFRLNYEFGHVFTKKINNSKEKHLNYMINEKLFALEAESIGLDTSRQVINYLNTINSDLATEELYIDEILSKVEIMDNEIDSVITRKSMDVKVKWLFSDSEFEINSLNLKLKSGIPFVSLFKQRYKLKEEIDSKELKTNRYLLGKKNPSLGKIVDTLESKKFSKPIFMDDGWYIIYLESFNQQAILTETDFTRLKTEAIDAVKMIKMNSISDKYVNNLMIDNVPIIKSTAFRILRSYLSNYILKKELYEQWSLPKKMDEALAELDNKSKSDISKLVLINMKSTEVTISQFLEWFWLRDQYIKFDNSSLEAYTLSLKDIVFRMVRDELLTNTAKKKGYFESDVVKKQFSWWREKVLSSAFKNYLRNTINVSSDEIAPQKGNEKDINIDIEKEYTAKLFRTIQKLKQKYSIVIDEDILDNIIVSEEENPSAISLYTIKKGGLIPRTPYPTIDSEWANWE